MRTILISQSGEVTSSISTWMIVLGAVFVLALVALVALALQRRK